MNNYLISLVGCLLLMVLMVVFALLGHRAGRRRILHSDESAGTGTGVVDAAVLSLLGLLIAFTFSNAYARFEKRRSLIVQEVNAIGTAYLRVDLLPEKEQPALRKLLREYTESRVRLWQLFPDQEAALAEFAHGEELQQKAWDTAIAASRYSQYEQARMLLLPALNEMIDLSSTRLTAIVSHPPPIIFLLLAVLSLAAAWMNGFGMSKSARPSYPHMFAFAAFVSLSLYVILDIEFPRFGLVTLEQPQSLFVELVGNLK
ncbi:MAG: DUF4239 domain-containing protein [Gemmataceae bacterium]